ncbi:MAG: lytic murein transglycosylase [Alphaproteobacteria bacterium]|nr:lytic murein transglycosylase [Alphaproteobacteria bacterium]
MNTVLLKLSYVNVSTSVLALALGIGLFGMSWSASGKAAEKNTISSAESLARLHTQSRSKDFSAWLVKFKERALLAGISHTTLEKTLNDIRYNQQVIRLDRRQSDFTRTIGEYLERSVTPERIAGGKKAMLRHQVVLNKLSKRYGVEKEVIVAIWGLETSYGGYMGKSSTIRSLATLAYDGRRSAFFENELIEALKILQNGDITLNKMIGSWAGAMGHTQFMPSSFNSYAVDFDGDGRRNIWSKNPTDALASAAAYLQNFGWISNQRWAIEVQLPDGFDLALANPGIRKSPIEWEKSGISSADKQAFNSMGNATLFLPAGETGPALMVSQNFEAIRKYNVTPTYIMATGLLSDALAGRSGNFVSSWPNNARLLSLSERKDMQKLMYEAGFDPKRYDGKIDTRVITAVQAYQSANGLPPDGYPSPTFLERLRQK